MEITFYVGLFFLWVIWIANWSGWATWNDVILAPFYWIFNKVFWSSYNSRYLGVEHNSLALGYWAMFFLFLTTMGLLCKYLITSKTPLDIGKSFIKALGFISMNIVVYEIGVFFTQIYSCYGNQGATAPYININFLQWAQIGFAQPDKALGCVWVMNFPVSIWSWEFSPFGWLQNWSLALIAAGVAFIYLGLWFNKSL